MRFTANHECINAVINTMRLKVRLRAGTPYDIRSPVLGNTTNYGPLFRKRHFTGNKSGPFFIPIYLQFVSTTHMMDISILHLLTSAIHLSSLLRL